MHERHCIGMEARRFRPSSGARDGVFGEQRVDELSSKSCERRALADADLQVALRPRFVELDDGWCLAQFAAMQCATGHQAEAHATTDHATDGFETADLDADVEMAAERCCGIHGERVDRRASVEHHERTGERPEVS